MSKKKYQHCFSILYRVTLMSDSFGTVMEEAIEAPWFDSISH